MADTLDWVDCVAHRRADSYIWQASPKEEAKKRKTQHPPLGLAAEFNQYEFSRKQCAIKIVLIRCAFIRILRRIWAAGKIMNTNGAAMARWRRR
ncbi:hypothetical protein KCP73_05310 [Salmonella enterica subsp. enterica]|nr:hypothetical protein KCP73_05310 [Salmonella enterica subsp. enterica]